MDKIKKLKNKKDRIEGDTIILHDLPGFGKKFLKKVLIITQSGANRRYEIKRTNKGGYLFN